MSKKLGAIHSAASRTALSNNAVVPAHHQHTTGHTQITPRASNQTDQTQTSVIADSQTLNTSAAKTKKERHRDQNIRNIDPDTLWDTKIYAAQTKQTMGEVVTEALERLVQEEEMVESNRSESGPELLYHPTEAT